MKSIVKVSSVALLGLAAAACSSGHHSATPVASASSSAAPAPVGSIKLHAPAASAAVAVAGERGSTAPTAPGPELAGMLKRPGFAHAFEAMDGASALPAWIKSGGVSQPSEQVQVGGKSMWLANACEDAGCGSGRVLVLIDQQDRKLQGVFVQGSGSSGASVQQYTWLGDPDAAAKAFLQGRVAAH